MHTFLGDCFQCNYHEVISIQEDLHMHINSSCAVLISTIFNIPDETLFHFQSTNYWLHVTFDWEWRLILFHNFGKKAANLSSWLICFASIKIRLPKFILWEFMQKAHNSTCGCVLIMMQKKDADIANGKRTTKMHNLDWLLAEIEQDKWSPSLLRQLLTYPHLSHTYELDDMGCWFHNVIAGATRGLSWSAVDFLWQIWDKALKLRSFINTHSLGTHTEIACIEQ